MKSFFARGQLAIDTLFQVVTDNAYLLSFTENRQHLVLFFDSYQQIEASYQQAVVDDHSHYKISKIKAGFVILSR